MVARTRTRGRWNARSYGLPPQDDSETEPEETPLDQLFADDAWGTAKSLEDLRQHPDFKKWQRGRGQEAEAPDVTDARLRVYRELRELDPDGFRRLLDEPAAAVTRPCGAAVLVAEYLCNTLATTLAALTLLAVESRVLGYALALALAANLYCWTRATSLFGRCAGLWWEETAWGHRGSARQCLASNAIEVLYCCFTGGLGGLVTISLRLRGAQSGQGLGERLCGLRLIQEVPADVQLPDTPPSSLQPPRGKASPRRWRH